MCAKLLDLDTSTWNTLCDQQTCKPSSQFHKRQSEARKREKRRPGSRGIVVRTIHKACLSSWTGKFEMRSTISDSPASSKLRLGQAGAVGRSRRESRAYIPAARRRGETNGDRTIGYHSTGDSSYF